MDYQVIDIPCWNIRRPLCRIRRLIPRIYHLSELYIGSIKSNQKSREDFSQRGLSCWDMMFNIWSINGARGSRASQQGGEKILNRKSLNHLDCLTLVGIVKRKVVKVMPLLNERFFFSLVSKNLSRRAHMTSNQHQNVFQALPNRFMTRSSKVDSNLHWFFAIALYILYKRFQWIPKDSNDSWSWGPLYIVSL